MKQKQAKKVTYKGTHQDFSKKTEEEKPQSTKKIYRAALFTLLLALCMAGGLFLPTTVHAASPSALKQYFAEGRVGAGFRQWLTISNMSAVACSVSVQEYYTVDGSAPSDPKIITFTVNALTRYTDSVNNDLGIQPNAATGATLSSIVKVNTAATPDCPGVVAERPMYFTNFPTGTTVSSGTDIIGATQLSTDFYFADVPTGVAGETFLAVFNPQGSTAHLMAMYYNPSGTLVTTDSLSVGKFSRGTFQPNNDNLPADVSVHIHSDQPVLVERPSYFPLQNNVSGAADVIGVTTPASDWFFAEGSTQSGTQENLIINNPDAVATPTVTILLVPSIGGTPILPITLPPLAPHAQKIINVNTVNTTGVNQIAAQIHSAGGNIVVERQMFTKYSGSTGWSGQGVTDAFGVTTLPTLPSSYSFAEGFTSVGFNEYLELQNTEDGPLTITITLVNMLGHSFTQTVTLPAMSRATENITDLVFNNLVRAGEDSRAYAISMTVTATGSFVAERTMYWNAFGTQGSSAMVGYSGN